MKYQQIPILLFFIGCFYGCKKNDHTVSIPETDEFSFTYNGKQYNYGVTGNIANAGVGKGLDGTPFINIAMEDVLGGRIHFEKTGCAYFEPGSTVVSLKQNCELSEMNLSGDIVPIDSTKVFIWQSGSLNVSFSGCVTKSGTDIVTGLNYQFDECAASGTFDLTLVNKNKETIQLTNGVVKFHHVVVR